MNKCLMFLVSECIISSTLLGSLYMLNDYLTSVATSGSIASTSVASSVSSTK